jgi:two-component system, sporulation sensor kinase E
MRRFVQRALNKLTKLDQAQLQIFIQDLARENDRLELLLDSMPDGVLVCDKTNRFLLCNKAAERHVPLSVQHLSERSPVWEIIEDSAIAGFVRETLVAQESVKEKEFVLGGFGTFKIIAVSILPLVSRGRIEGTIISVHDVSERRRQETRLRQSENLAKLSTLAAGVAHEIKNPLGSISIHIQLIQRFLAQQTCVVPPDVNEHLTVVTEEIERLNRIVVDFLFAVRPMDVQLLKAGLNPLVADVVAFMRPELAQANIGIVEHLSSEVPDILMDDRHIKQALLNLFKNAVNAMPNGGELTIRTYRSPKANQEAVLEITDTGVGMSPEVLEKIFEPFFTTRDFGSGIGLTLVFKIIKEHGGEIMVESQEGQGTTFILAFPAVVANRQLLSAPGENIMQALVLNKDR